MRSDELFSFLLDKRQIISKQEILLSETNALLFFQKSIIKFILFILLQAEQRSAQY